MTFSVNNTFFASSCTILNMNMTLNWITFHASTPSAPSSLSPSVPSWASHSSHDVPSFSSFSSITSFHSSRSCTLSSIQHHGDALQAVNERNFPSATADQHRYLSLQHLQITHISLYPAPLISLSSVSSSLYPLPWWNEGLMKINDASQLPYPSPICFLRSCGGRNSPGILSILPVSCLTGSQHHFFVSQERRIGPHMVGWSSWRH